VAATRALLKLILKRSADQSRKGFRFEYKRGDGEDHALIDCNYADKAATVSLYPRLSEECWDGSLLYQATM